LTLKGFSLELRMLYSW